MEKKKISRNNCHKNTIAETSKKASEKSLVKTLFQPATIYSESSVKILELGTKFIEVFNQVNGKKSLHCPNWCLQWKQYLRWACYFFVFTVSSEHAFVCLLENKYLFQVIKKDTWTTSINFSWCLHCWLWTDLWPLGTTS